MDAGHGGASGRFEFLKEIALDYAFAIWAVERGWARLTVIRRRCVADAAALAAIYGHHVLHGLGTFEEVPPSAEDMAARLAAVLERGLPYLVAEVDEIGSPASPTPRPFRTRAAYRYTVEDSVYIAPDRHRPGARQGAAGAQVIAACEALGLRQMLAVIGDSGNAGSIGLHRACGFEEAGDRCTASASRPAAGSTW